MERGEAIRIISARRATRRERTKYESKTAVRGKHYERYRQGTNVVLLDPDVAEAFRDSAAVNDALRLLISLAQAKVAPGTAGAREHQRAKKVSHRTRQKTARR